MVINNNITIRITPKKGSEQLQPKMKTIFHIASAELIIQMPPEAYQNVKHLTRISFFSFSL